MSPEPTQIFDGETEEHETDSEFPIDPDADEKSEAPEPAAEKKADPPAPPAEEVAGSSRRDYVIFKEIGKDTFKKIAVVNATTSDGAIDSLGEEGLEDGASYSAPPARYWNPQKVKVEKTTKITIG